MKCLAAGGVGTSIAPTWEALGKKAHGQETQQNYIHDAWAALKHLRGTDYHDPEACPNIPLEVLKDDAAEYEKWCKERSLLPTIQEFIKRLKCPVCFPGHCTPDAHGGV